VAVLTELWWFEKDCKKSRYFVSMSVGVGERGGGGITSGRGWVWLVPLDRGDRGGSNGVK
jgi:hypothetical protein